MGQQVKVLWEGCAAKKLAEEVYMAVGALAILLVRDGPRFAFCGSE